jgi:hypothetical protein
MNIESKHLPKIFTEEQLTYITHHEITDTKLIATAGAGKTRCIITKMDYLIKENKLQQNEILMLTFSRFTRDDFLNKVKKFNITTIGENSIKTIDSFSKSLIDVDNDIDVSLLSYKFMKYLELTDANEIKNNNKLKYIKSIFVDESQDLNEIQYNILMLLKEKNGTAINLIGDPNQNIYQFRNSSDKYLNEFNAKTFYLTKNFRSFDSIINFSKYLRPIKTLDITGKLGKSNNLPMIIFHQNDSELEKHLINLLTNAKKNKIKFEDIAILSPTRGRMRGYGKSHGLCLVSNLLYKNKFNFKQFYEETSDEIGNGIKYEPEKGHINVLTYMGSKGLEWKYVILVDADICLINKRQFSEEKHKNDQYLLYVACSRAIENMIIFSKYNFYEGNLTFQLNPWFNLIPSSYYKQDLRFTKHFKYPKIKNHDMGNSHEKKITKIIDKFDEKTLNELFDICMNKNNYKKTVTKIYDKDFSMTLNSNMFLNKYVKNLFFTYYCMKHNKPKKKYIDIENIINSKHIITDVSISVNEWFYINREHLSWELFDQEKINMDKNIVDAVETKFSRNIKLSDHTIVNDSYFKSFILSISEYIKENYKNYLESNDTLKIRTYIFNLMIVTYSLETQHYFHAISKGKKFKHILKICNEMFNKIEEFAFSTAINFTEISFIISGNNLTGNIDLIEQKENEHLLWEIKCSSDISLKHILQLLIYNIVYHKIKDEHVIDINFINFLKGDMINAYLYLSFDNLNKIKALFNI